MAYTLKQAFYDVLEQIMSTHPEYLNKKISPHSRVCLYTEQIKLLVAKRLLERTDFFKHKEDRLMLQLLINHCESNGQNKVWYRRNAKEGRRFAACPSLQSIPKYIRWLITGDISDIDQVNAHMVILLDFATYADDTVDLPMLREYTSNREAQLKRVCNEYGVERPWAKKLILMVTYQISLNTMVGWNSDMEKWIIASGAQLKIVNGEYQHPQFIHDLRDELKIAGALVLGLPMFSSFNEMEYKARALSLALQSVEDFITSTAEGFFHYNDMIVSTLMFDGLMVNGMVTEDNLDELKISVHAALKNKYGIDSQLTFSNTYHA